MTIKERITKLENEKFLLEMKDHWTKEDFDLVAKLAKEIKELKKKA